MVSGSIFSDSIQLTRFHVENLFGEYSYTIPINTTAHVTAVIAPNGTGKTLCLRLIHALFAERWGLFADTTYDRLEYVFNNGVTIEITKNPNSQSSLLTDGDPADLSLIVKLMVPGHALTTWSPRPIGRERPTIEQFVPFLSRISNGRWRHDHTGELFSLGDVLEQFADMIPSKYRERVFGQKPELLSLILSKINCKLIETQRLLILKEPEEDERYYRQRKPKSTLAISQKALKLRDIIAKEINAYATLSQSLDRSFPRRVINRSTFFEGDNLKSKLSELDARRSDLMAAGILDTEEEEVASQ